MTGARGLVVILALIAPATAAHAQDTAAVATDTAGLIALGRTIFQGRGLCFSCHGKAGEGVLGPTTRLAGRPLTHTKANVADLVALIESGVDSAHSTSGQVMPPRGGSRITNDQVTAVAWYVLELQRGTPPGSP